MLNQIPDLTPEASTKHGLPTSGKLSLDCGQTETKLSMWKTFDQNPEALVLRKKLDLLPRFKPSVVETQASIRRGMGKHIETFFTLRYPEEAGVYLTSLPQELRFRFVIKLVAYALKTDEADARLVSNFFVQATSNGQCTPYVFEKGFMPMAGRLDKYAISFPKAYYYMAMMLKGAGFENEPERLKRIVSQLEDSDKLVSHLSLRSFQ
jgi:translation initiation factor 4G